MGEIEPKLFLFIYTFFLWSAYRSDPWTDFLRAIAQKTPLLPDDERKFANVIDIDAIHVG